MKIESLIKRSGGTKIDMDAPKRQYHFKPTEEDDRHIADVDVEHHAKTFLRIKEGYRAVDADDLDDDQDDNPLPTRELKSSLIHNATYTIKGGDVIELEDLVNMAFDDSGLDEDGWNDLSDQERYEFIDATLKELQEGVHGDGEESKVQTQEPANASGDTADNKPADDTAADQNGDNDTSEAAKSVDAAAASVNPDQNGNGVNDDLEGLTRKQLEPIYKQRFGRLPSSQMTVPQIRAALSEDDD